MANDYERRKRAVERMAERLKKNSGMSSEQAHKHARDVAEKSDKTAKHKEK